MRNLHSAGQYLRHEFRYLCTKGFKRSCVDGILLDRAKGNIVLFGYFRSGAMSRAIATCEFSGLITFNLGFNTANSYGIVVFPFWKLDVVDILFGFILHSDEELSRLVCDVLTLKLTSAYPGDGFLFANEFYFFDFKRYAVLLANGIAIMPINDIAVPYEDRLSAPLASKALLKG